MSYDEIRREVYEEDYKAITGEDWDDNNNFDLYEFVDERQYNGVD